MPKTLVDNELFVDFDEPAADYDSDSNPLTDAQVNFFKNSKCVDDDGALLVVYHASPSNFTEFDIKRSGTGGGSIYGKGFYFCDSDFGLDQYGKYIKKYYLNLKNPFRWEIPEGDDDYYNLDIFVDMLKVNNFSVSDELLSTLEADISADGGLDTLIEQTCGFDLAQKYFIRAGYDGVMNLEIGDYVAFKPEQIKLCSNKQPTVSNNIAA